MGVPPAPVREYLFSWSSVRGWWAVWGRRSASPGRGDVRWQRLGFNPLPKAVCFCNLQENLCLGTLTCSRCGWAAAPGLGMALPHTDRMGSSAVGWGYPLVPPATPCQPPDPGGGEMPGGGSGQDLHCTVVTCSLFRVKTSCFFQGVGVRFVPVEGRARVCVSLPVGAELCAVSRVPEARTQLGLRQLPGNEAPPF